MGPGGGAGEDWGWAGCLCPSTASWTGHRRDRSTPAPRPSRAWVAQPPLSPGVPAGCPRPGGCSRYGASPGHSGEPPGLGGRHGGAGEQPEAALLGSEGGEGAAGGAEGRQILGRRSPPTLVSLQPGITGLGAGGRAAPPAQLCAVPPSAPEAAAGGAEAPCGARPAGASGAAGHHGSSSRGEQRPVQPRGEVGQADAGGRSQVGRGRGISQRGQHLQPCVHRSRRCRAAPPPCPEAAAGRALTMSVRGQRLCARPAARNGDGAGPGLVQLGRGRLALCPCVPLSLCPCSLDPEPKAPAACPWGGRGDASLTSRG